MTRINSIGNMVVPETASPEAVREYTKLLNERFIDDPDEMSDLDRRKRELRLKQLAEEIWGEIP